MDLTEIGSEMEWIQLANDRPEVGPCENCDEPSGSDATDLIK
jgi:hypothetical protein